MSYFPVDDALHSHPKARKAGLEALGLWTVSGSYSMAYLTDGFVPEWFVKEKPKGVALANRLISAGLWIRAEKDGEQGWQFHQWKNECTKAIVTAAREKARQRKAKSRESHQESQGKSHRDIPRDERRESRDMSGTNPTQPNPTQEKEPPSPPERESSPPQPLVRQTGSDKALARFEGIPGQPSALARQVAVAYSDSLPVPIEAKVLTQVTGEIDRCLRSQIPPDAIARGIQSWAESDSWSPSQIPNFVAKANRRPNGNHTGKPTEAALSYQDAAEQLLAKVTTK